ncbi:MAG: hypothetical protein JO067_01635 [Cupriavidus sp.]|nr:hypothetical protein [Cupriavidus sp.]
MLRTLTLYVALATALLVPATAFCEKRGDVGNNGAAPVVGQKSLFTAIEENLLKPADGGEGAAASQSGRYVRRSGTPPQSSQKCNRFLDTPVRQRALCDLDEIREVQSKAAADGLDTAIESMLIRDRLELIQAIDTGQLSKARQREAYQAMVSDELKLLEEHRKEVSATRAENRQVQAAILAAMAARAAMPIINLETPAAPPAQASPPRSITCARQYGLPGYTRCTAD